MSALLDDLPVPGQGTLDMYALRFGIDRGAEWLGWANAVGRPEKKSVHEVVAAVAELVYPLPLVRWPDDALAVAMPVVQAVRMVGRAYQKNGEPGCMQGNSASYWVPAYTVFLHVLAGQAVNGAGALWSWPECVVMISRSNDLWSVGDSYFPAHEHLEILQRLDGYGLMGAAQVRIDYMTKKPLPVSIKYRARLALRQYAKIRRNKAQKIIDRGAEFASAMSPTTAQKYSQELAVVQAWRDSAQAQYDYWDALV